MTFVEIQTHCFLNQVFLKPNNIRGHIKKLKIKDGYNDVHQIIIQSKYFSKKKCLINYT